jgi:Protein of unknown function (DUF1186)
MWTNQNATGNLEEGDVVPYPPVLPMQAVSNRVQMLTIPEILKELEPYTGRFPKKAMPAAIRQREAIMPELLRVLEAVAAAPADWAQREDNMLPVFAIFLLAQFREKPAYPLLVTILSAPGGRRLVNLSGACLKSTREYLQMRNLSAGIVLLFAAQYLVLPLHEASAAGALGCWLF